MRRIALSLGLLATAAALAMPNGAMAAPKYYECQHPVQTGVEISKLSHITPSTACPVALALYKWENSGGHEPELYGCRGSAATPGRRPYLKLHTFDGWKLSLRGPTHYDFTMSRGNQSFQVGGTDFPINCS